MTLFVTTYPNDDDLAKALGSMAIRVPIPHGDVCFWGAGDDDGVIRVACERKKIGDMASCILNGRYLHQAQSAKEAGMDVLCLITEGRYRSSPIDGLLEIPGWDREHSRAGWKPVIPAIAFSRFDQYLTELEWLTGIIVKHSEMVQGTVDIIKALWHNFQTAPSEHRSLRQIYKAPINEVLLCKPGLVRRTAAELKGIGWGRSKAVGEHFSSVQEMANADEDEWTKIPNVGQKMAKQVVQALRGRA